MRLFKNAFSIVGAVVAVAGVAFLVASALVSGQDRVGLIFPGAFLVLFGLGFYRVGRRIGKVVWRGADVLEAGRPGRGTITRMWETGMTINDQPVFGFEMDLEVEGVQTGTASVQQMVPRMLAGAVLPGHTVAVKVDAEDPSEVVIDWSEAPAPAGAQAPGGTGALADALREAGVRAAGEHGSAEELLRTGRRGTAKLQSVTDAGEIGELGLAGGDPDKEDDRLYLIAMDVKLPGRAAYPARVGHRVPDRLIGRVGPGLQVPVAVDRDNDQSVAIDWDAVQ